MDTATDIPFDESSAKFLAQFRYAAAGFLKTLILAREKQDSDFVTGEMRERWVLDEFGTEKRSCEFLLGVALERRLVFLKKYVGYRDSIPCPETEEEERLETLRENVATFVSAAGIDRVSEAVRRGDTVDWDGLARWELLPAIRDALDELPEAETFAHSGTQTPPTTNEPDAFDTPPLPDNVTLLQMASIVNKSKRTLERYKARMPLPTVKGGEGKSSEWSWREVRPWLEKQFVRKLPEIYPADRFRRS